MSLASLMVISFAAGVAVVAVVSLALLRVVAVLLLVRVAAVLPLVAAAVRVVIVAAAIGAVVVFASLLAFQVLEQLLALLLGEAGKELGLGIDCLGRQDGVEVVAHTRAAVHGVAVELLHAHLVERRRLLMHADRVQWVLHLLALGIYASHASTHTHAQYTHTSVS